MPSRRAVGVATVALALLVAAAAGAWVLARSLAGAAPGADGFADRFRVDPAALADTGTNPYFRLEPGYRLRLAGGGEEVVITVLDETELVDGVRTRVVEERETRGGELVEVSRNFFAADPVTGDVYYFGEDVDDYAGGRVTGHGGSWRSGVDGARFGLLMPGAPRVGMRHYQEVAPGVALDRAEVVSTSDAVRVPFGTLRDVVTVEETSPLEPLVTGRKSYAPGVGLVRDDGLELVAVGP